MHDDQTREAAPISRADERTPRRQAKGGPPSEPTRPASGRGIRPGWTPPPALFAYPPPPPSPRDRFVAALRRWGLLILLLLTLPALALWVLAERDAMPTFELSPDERSTLAGGAPVGPPVGEAPAEPLAEVEPSALSIVTDPADAAVRIDFDDVGLSPIRDYEVAPGTYLVSVSKPGYLTFDTLLTMPSGVRPVLDVALQPWGGAAGGEPPPLASGVPAEPVPPPVAEPGTEQSAPAAAQRGAIRVVSQPSSVLVWLDGERAGATPVTLDDVPAGEHTVGVRAEDGRSRAFEVTVVPGETATVRASFAEAVGTLTVLARPWGNIFIDGRLHSASTDVEYRVQLPVGRHRVRVEHPALGSYTRDVEVVAGTPARLDVNLNEVGER